MEVDCLDDVLERPRGSLSAPGDYGSPFLRHYQQDASFTLSRALDRYNTVLDASDTGLGKTWVALDVVKRLGWNFGVICPANVVSKWKHTAAGDPYNLEPEFVTSYDKMRQGKGGFATRNGRGSRTWFEWCAVDKVVLIFDEIHACQNPKSINSRLLLAAVNNPWIKVIGLSATIAESPLGLRTAGYGLGLHNYHDWWIWCMKNGCRPGPFGGLLFNSGTADSGRLTANQVRARAKLNEIHQRIFPSHGCRIRKLEVADQLPDNTVIAEEVDVDFHHPMVKEEIKLVDLKDEDWVSDLVSITRERQKLELAKVPVFLDRAEELRNEGNSVIVFLNFTRTIEILESGCKKLGWGYSKVVGGMLAGVRDASLTAFQTNRVRICLCQAEAGAQSIDLDDVTGTAPRGVLISPTYSARQLLQMLGRAHRMTTKSKVMQWILFASGTVEERACLLVQHKLNNLSLLNDGDLTTALKIK